MLSKALAKIESLQFAQVQHLAVLFLYLVGFVGSLFAVLAGLPKGASSATYALMLGPVLLFAVTHLIAFFQNPPSDPAQAFKQGQADGRGPQRGFAAMRVIGLLAVVGMLLALIVAPRSRAVVSNAPAAVALQGQGCAWFNANAKPLEQDLGKDGMCVLSAIIGGLTDPAAVAAQCVPLTVEQGIAIAKSLYNYYALGQTDSGLAGAAMPPFYNIPGRVGAEDLERLRAFVSQSK